jgi:pyruvate formate lyase activating enzyme
MKMTGTIFDIKRFAIHDGPGIRTTVFMKGCTLNCIWCQNPEGIPFGRDLWVKKEYCIKCSTCVSICGEGALSLTDYGIIIDHGRCSYCNRCVEACPTKAIRRIDRNVELEELIQEVMRDELFYQVSGGGVTLSGGEPLAQSDFVIEFLKRLKELNIHTCIETALNVPKKVVEQLPQLVDHFFADCKIFDEMQHRRYIGSSNVQIIENIRYLATHAKSLTIRIPLIPDLTATEDNLKAIARFIRSLGANIPIELLNYNWLSHSKYEELGLKHFNDTLRQFSKEEIRQFYKFIEQPNV